MKNKDVYLEQYKKIVFNYKVPLHTANAVFKKYSFFDSSKYQSEMVCKYNVDK